VVFPRQCKKCNARFQPVSRFNFLCQNCLKNVKNENFKKMISIRFGMALSKIKLKGGKHVWNK